MNRVMLSGVVSNIKVYDGKVRCCFCRIKTPEGSSFSLAAFDKTVEKLATHENKYALLTGYLKTGKKKDGTWKEGYEFVCTTVESMETEAETSSERLVKSDEKRDDEIPF